MPPHLDYGDVMYHIPSKVCEFSHNIVLPNLMEKQEILLSEDFRCIRLSFITTEAYRRSPECYFAKIFY